MKSPRVGVALRTRVGLRMAVIRAVSVLLPVIPLGSLSTCAEEKTGRQAWNTPPASGIDAAELADHNGYLGSDLDDLIQLSGPLPPLSYLLAGWARSIDTPGAKATRSVMGSQNWELAPSIVWPSAGIDLFIADLLAAGTPLTNPSSTTTSGSAGDRESGVNDPETNETGFGSGAAASGVVLAAALEGGIGEACGAIQGFVDGAIASLYSGIEALSKKAASVPIIRDILAAGIDLFGLVVKGTVEAVRELAAAVFAPVKLALEILGTLNSLQTPKMYRWLKTNCSVESLHGYPIDTILPVLEAAYG